MKGIQKRGILAALVAMLIAWNCVIVYAGDVWCEYGDEYIDSPVGK